jgi:hypothetical protein
MYRVTQSTGGTMDGHWVTLFRLKNKYVTIKPNTPGGHYKKIYITDINPDFRYLWDHGSFYLR